MKKVLFCILLLISVATVHAEETVNLELKWIPNVYYSYQKDGLTYWGQMAYAYVDGKIAYCLDIYKTITKYTYVSTDEVQENNVVLLVGYFGYGYNGEFLEKDYIATQKLIWNYLGMSVKITTQSAGKGASIDLDDNKLKIINRVNKYAIFPKYDSNFKFELGTTNQFRDLNEISDNFNILNGTTNNIYSRENNLIFEANESGTNSFYLQTKYEKNYPNIIYTAPDSQKIMIIGEVKNLIRQYNYEVFDNKETIPEEPNNNEEEIPLEDNKEENSEGETPLEENKEENNEGETPLEENREENSEGETPLEDNKEESNEEEIPLEENKKENNEGETPLEENKKEDTNNERESIRITSVTKLPFLGVYYEKIIDNYMYFTRFYWMQ